MLCQRVDSLTEAAKRLGLPFVAEEKYDGERIQAHKDGERVVLFSRRLDDVTLQFPDIAATVRKLNAKTLVLDCEAMPVDPVTGKLLPFQVLMSRRRKHGVAEAVDEIPVTLFVFDVLYVEGKSMLDVPYEKRYAAVQKLVHTTKAVALTTRVLCKNTDAAEELFNKVVDNGGEGIVMKSLVGAYEAGERSWNWVKWKPAYTKELRDTFDLVIIGGFHGTGKRGGMLSSYLCAAYDKKTDMFYSFCKVASGFSEADLALLPTKLSKYKVAHKPARVSVGKTMTPDVWFEPAIVIEIVGDEVTKSPNHTAGGLALRFPRFLKYRNDKKAEQATTVAEIKKMVK
jgi:DNA ligase-1